MYKPVIKLNTLSFILSVELFAILFILGTYTMLPHLRSTTPSAITAPLSFEDSEKARVSHQHTDLEMALFNFQAQEYRVDTDIRFHYNIIGNYGPVYLQVQQNGKFEEIALVDHPLLHCLSWPRLQGNISLYQADNRYQSIEQLLADPPRPSLLASDKVAARVYNLKPEQYVSLEDLQDLKGISYILTSYQPSPPDGWWRTFDSTIDLTQAEVSNGSLQGKITINSLNEALQPDFYIGQFHVNYNKIRP